MKRYIRVFLKPFDSEEYQFRRTTYPLNVEGTLTIWDSLNRSSVDSCTVTDDFVFISGNRFALNGIPNFEQLDKFRNSIFRKYAYRLPESGDILRFEFVIKSPKQTRKRVRKMDLSYERIDGRLCSRVTVEEFVVNKGDPDVVSDMQSIYR